MRADVGVLSERRWQMLDWEIPADEACPCWWVSTVDGLTFATTARYPLDSSAHQPASWNACEPDKSLEVKIICRSLTTLRLELSHNRVATVVGVIILSAQHVATVALADCFHRLDYRQTT